MAHPTETTRQSIRNAIADYLRDEGKLPTGKAIFAMVGRGSLSTVYQELEAWEKKASAKLINPDAPLALWDAFQSIWAEALQIADSRFAKDRQELQSQADEHRQLVEASQQRCLALLEETETSKIELCAIKSSSAERERQLEDQLLKVSTQFNAAAEQIVQIKDDLKQLQSSARHDQEQHVIQLKRADDRYDALEIRTAKEIDNSRQESRQSQSRAAKLELELRDSVKSLAVARSELLNESKRAETAISNYLETSVLLQTTIESLNMYKQKDTSWEKRASSWEIEKKALESLISLGQEKLRECELNAAILSDRFNALTLETARKNESSRQRGK